ncbi:hypothetical protein D3C84_602640 [compost metagenome]
MSRAMVSMQSSSPIGSGRLETSQRRICPSLRRIWQLKSRTKPSRCNRSSICLRSLRLTQIPRSRAERSTDIALLKPVMRLKPSLTSISRPSLCRDSNRPSGEAWNALANFSSEVCSCCWVSLSWVMSRTTTTSAGVVSRSNGSAEIRPVNTWPLLRRKGISRLRMLPACKRCNSPGPTPGMPQMFRLVAVWPMTSSALRPICSSNASLTSSRQPSLRRAITRMSGHCWNTEANFCSDWRSASSVRLVSLMSIIRPRITGS